MYRSSPAEFSNLIGRAEPSIFYIYNAADGEYGLELPALAAGLAGEEAFFVDTSNCPIEQHRNELPLTVLYANGAEVAAVKGGDMADFEEICQERRSMA